jgi:hypothetical protein
MTYKPWQLTTFDLGPFPAWKQLYQSWRTLGKSEDFFYKYNLDIVNIIRQIFTARHQ